MSAIAVGNRLEGLTIRQVGSIADEVCRIAAEIGAPVRSVTSNTYPSGSSSVWVHPEDSSLANLLATELALTNVSDFPSHRTWNGDWCGVEVMVLGDLPTEDDPRPVAPTYQPLDVTGWSPEELADDQALDDEIEQNYQDDLAAWLVRHPASAEAQARRGPPPAWQVRHPEASVDVAGVTTATIGGVSS